MRKLHIATSPLTNAIYVGHVLTDGIWADKQDLTVEALVAVAEHALRFGQPVVLSNKRGPEYRITVERLQPSEEGKPTCQ